MAGNIEKPTGDTSFHLYSFFKSSSAARLRIALALKNITPKTSTVNLLANDQHSVSYLATNPSKTVPTLVITTDTHSFTITQSVAALEYLDEAFPQTYQLLPPISQPEHRATVRTLVGIIASDIQAPTSLRTLKRVRVLASSSNIDPEEAAKSWAREVIIAGLTAFEAVAEKAAGRYSVGDSITMADCVLVPAVWHAEGFGIDTGGWPTLRRVYEELSLREEVVRSHWRNQADTPVELRGE